MSKTLLLPREEFLALDGPFRSMKEIQRDHDRKLANEKWLKWRKRVASRLPELSARVFALREHGMVNQSSLEHTLGQVIAGTTGTAIEFLRPGEAALAKQLIFELDVEDLYKDLKAAEAHVPTKGRFPVGSTVHVISGGYGANGANGQVGVVVEDNTVNPHGAHKADVKLRLKNGEIWGFNTNAARLLELLYEDHTQ